MPPTVSAVVLSPLERAGATLVRGLGALPAPLRRLLSGPPALIDGQVLDGRAAVLLRLLARFPQPPKSEVTVAQARERTRRSAAMLAAPPPTMARVEELDLPGPAGGIGARLYAAPGGDGGARPLVVYYHGGGWVSGDLDSHDGPCRLLAAQAGALVLSVDYRRAPEDPFPAAADDAVAAFEWAAANARDLGADPERIAVAGDSAGGNLAAVASRVARDRGGPLPAMQLLIYPGTDLSVKRPSYRLFGEGFFLTEEDIDWYRGHYLPVDDESTAGDPLVSPLLADDLSGLPPAYVATAGFDPLRDEGEAYADALRAAGVTTALRRHPSLIHGYANLTGYMPAAHAAMVEAAGALRMGLASPRVDDTPAPRRRAP